MIVLTAIFLSILCGLGAQKCGKYYSTRVSYKTNCGFMGWQRCTNHITKRRYKEYCCPGYTSYPDCRPLDSIGIIPKAIFEDEKSAKTFLSRHKRSLSEECREGCYWEEVDEAYRNTERTKEYMINYKCRGACTSGYFCHATGTFGHISYLQVQCLPICNGLTSLTNACNKLYPYDMIYYRDGNNRNSGAGFCSSPGQCSNCADGFYSYGGECLICPSITNCYHRRCTTASDNHCEWCKYEIIDKRYYRGYTRHYDGSMKQCRKACSWRSDSTRCYPGICSNEIVESCKCTSGFGGAQCTSILEETSILYAELKLHNPPGETVTTPADPSYTSSQSTKFTNKKNLNKAEMEFHAKFVTSGIPPRLHADHFVTYFNYGIVYGQMKITFVVGSSSTGKTYSCPASEYNPIQTGYVCSRTISNNNEIALPNVGHSDKIIFTIEARNGGYLRYLNRDNSPPLSNYVSLTGKTTIRNYAIQMDYEDPYFPCPKQFKSPIHITDITDQNLISFTWEPWVDDLSGIDYYAYQVFKMAVYGSVLTETSNMLYSFETTVQRGEFNLTDPGMYAIILTAFDKAGNNKSTRALLLFDNQSEIEKQSGTRIAVVESTVETNTTWIILETSQLHVTWHNRFINKRHHLNGWLFPVGDNSHVDSLYDDYYGQRTVGWLTNIRGIVKFHIKYTVSGPDVKANQEYTNVEDILPETEMLNVFWNDGQKLDISVKATDIFGQYIEDSITVYKDSSGPLVENVWLTYGNKTNKTDFYVHRIEDLSDMIIEWEAFDYHSGLQSVHWKMYHNFTGDDVVWGNSYISAQGNAENMTACEDLYGAAPRGYGCYCTLYHGCFHRHFYVEPEKVLRSDLIQKTDEGSSDLDYFLEITVINSAQIATVITRKMHVDKSPPHDETELEVITCNGLTYSNGGCNESYLYDGIYYRDGGSRNSGGGNCSAPEQCTNCQDGFYASAGQCLICPLITNCNHRRCTTTSDNYCEWCKHEIMDRQYYRGYTRHYDGSMKQCRKTCSWRSDSTRCYPGECGQEIIESCVCTSGFGGAQCDTITEETSIVYAEIKLHSPAGEVVTTPIDPNYTDTQSILYTNRNTFNKAEIEFHANFVTSGTPPPLHADHYVTNFSYGIIYGQMKVEFVIGSLSSIHTYSCPATEDFPIKSNYVCSRTSHNNSEVYLPKFGHSDKLIFTIEARNGGYLQYLNREYSPALSSRTSLKGITTKRSYVVQWDNVDPYFPGLHLLKSPFNTADDITEQNLIRFTWDSWRDDLSGLDYYAYQVYQLTVYGAVLREKSEPLYSYKTTAQMGEISLTDPGMYSVILTAYDKAGNNKSARSLLLFDDQSVVEKQSKTRIVVAGRTTENNKSWIISEASQLNVTWHNTFINERHHLNGWLLPVGTNSHVDNLYDDYYGRRTVGWITNIRGIVKFEIKYIVSGPDVIANQEYTNVEDILPEAEMLNVFWNDGQKLDISVKATDIFEKYIEDTITVYKDSSGPIVENVWLTYGNKTNKTDFYIHRVEDLSKMIIEWDAFDYHSGLHSVHWKLYTYLTGNEVLHGNSSISAQGNAENMAACEDLYGAAPRGHDCYCTLYHGCFHRHFYVEPEIVLRTDLISRTDEGSSDFFLEITVFNSAKISTVLTRKIHVNESPPPDGTGLDAITCNGLTYSNGACNEPYLNDGIYYRGGGFRNSGEGNCSAPEQCTDCQDGFYASAGQCLICPLITNCNHRRCTTTSDNYCEWCKYEIMDQRYYRGYTRHYDGSMKQCRKTCSWRSDSTRCYPGECGQEIIESCVCTSGFGGAQCDTITEETSILYAEIKLHSPSGEVVTTPIDPNETHIQSTSYTNKNTFNKAEIEFHAKFVTSGIPPPLHADHYVTNFSYGIIYGQMKIEFVIGSLSINYTYSCPATEDFPIKSNYVCSRTSHNNSEVYLPKFGHNDKLIFTIEARNGGYLQYLNREYSPALSSRTSLKGITTKRSYVVQWDNVDPYFPGLHLLKSPFNTADDITEQNLIRFTWDSWRDDLSGIDYYTYQVYQLTVYGAVLREKSEPIYSYKTTAQMGEISLTDPGMYSVILTAFDKAGNNKSARSLLLFDDQSVVEKQSKTRIVVAEMTTENNKTWMISEASQLNVTWHNTFINERHHLNGWLLPVGTNRHVDNLYDDYYGRRTVGWMTNIRGIVKFDIKYTVSGPDVIANQEYTNVEDILPETEILNVFWNDGQKLDISVKATDIFEKYIEDSITVYKDSSGPIVENLWLTYGNKTNKTDLYIHRVEDLSKMIIEWDAFDYHSGLHSVHWKLYNYLTGNEVLHGNSSISAQGNAENMAACEDLYGAAPRGHDCYCTLYHGCFHRHFYVVPEIVLRTDLISRTDEGSSDFFLEIAVFNSAKISTVLTRKIHVNESPLHDGTGLDAITCNGLTYSNGACNEPYLNDGIYYRGGGSRNSGEGNCSAPEQCTNCQDGFYASAGQCLICPLITNCNHRRCTTTSDNYCEWCKYEIMDQRYFRGYTRHYDGSMKQCRKTCSWRSDSTRCYPGECGQEIVESCVCTSGFVGAQCDTITEETSILYAEIKLHSPSGEVVTTPIDPNETHIQSTSYTNKNTFNKAEIEFHAKFVTSGIPPPLHADHYVTNFSYGIIYGQMKIEFVIGSLSINYTYSCPATEDFPIKSNYECSRTSHNNSEVYLPNFGHNDKLIFTIEARNGGNIQYLNRDYSPALSNRTSLKGITTKRSYVVQWDYVDPYFPSLHLLKSPFNIITDITEQNLISFTWDSWRDDLAGIDYYAYQVYQLTVNSAVLREKSEPLYSYKTTAQMGEYNLTDPGMYSVILTAFDKAGNNKSARSLLFFDDQSVVEKQPKSGIAVAEMTTENNKSWIISDASQLNVTWHNTFINERHHLNGWLLPVGTNSHVDNLYDDVYGRRTAGRITNIRGIVKFDIRYTVSGPGVIANQEYTNVEDILPEAEILNVFWDDGQKLDISVKATDIFEKYIEDSITVYKDSSGPILENLWLTYGNKTNKTDYSVHRIEDLSEMIIEWDAFDYHSGLQSVHWKIYHNFSGNEVLHGNLFISAQGNAEKMAACEGLYGVAPRGSDCYCTLYHGCFHRHFYVKPEIVFRTCLLPRTDKGISGLDYFLEITVVNSAKIATVLTREIHIDGSPPHDGTVPDELKFTYQDNTVIQNSLENRLPTKAPVKAQPTQPEQEISPPLPSVPSSCFDYQTSFKEGDRV